MEDDALHMGKSQQVRILKACAETAEDRADRVQAALEQASPLLPHLYRCGLDSELT